MLPRHRKLTRREIIEVYRRGKFLKNHGVTLKFLPNFLQKSRFSVVISKKICPDAHSRNRLKRLTYSLVSDFSSPFDIILTFTVSVVNLSYEEISTHVNQVLSKIPLV